MLDQTQKPVFETQKDQASGEALRSTPRDKIYAIYGQLADTFDEQTGIFR